jgi:hypothetical protein
MRELHRGLIRILKGPTGGLLTSLALAAFLGGVAIAAPGPSLGPASEHHGGVAPAGGPVEGLSIDAGASAGQSHEAATSEVRPRVQPPGLPGGGAAGHGSYQRSAPDQTGAAPGNPGGSGQGGDGADAQPPNGPGTPPAEDEGPATGPGSRPDPNGPTPGGPASPDTSQGDDRGGSPNQPEQDHVNKPSQQDQPNQPSGDERPSGSSGSGTHGDPGGSHRR